MFTLLGALLHAARPKQWAKNVLVFVAPAAAGTLLHGGTLGKALVAFVSFSMTASGLYLVNDIRDVESDRMHPRKRSRPIAAGTLPINVAAIAAVILTVGGIVLGTFGATWRLGLTLVVYSIITLAYSFALKRTPVIELACVASGFVLRATGGGAATNTRLSVWFLVVISFGALFIVTGKRLAEMPKADGTAGEARTVLEQYTKGFLEATLTLTATVSITAYCLWAFENSGLAARAHGREIWIQLTVVPIVLGALHILLLLDQGQGGAPEDLAYRDRMLQALGIIWFGLIMIGLYA